MSFYAHLINVPWLWIVSSYDILPLIPVPVLPHLLRPLLLPTRYAFASERACQCAGVQCHIEQFEHGSVDGVDA